jgi:hypothetical protein
VKKIVFLLLGAAAAVLARKKLMESKSERSAWASSTDTI